MSNNYTLIDLERDVESIIQELAEVRARKGHDYSGTTDTLDNLRAFGWKGVVVRLGDKFHRLKHFMLGDGELKVKDESIEDTMQDMINYAIFQLILYRQEKAKNQDVPPSSKEGFASKAQCRSETVSRKGVVVDFKETMRAEEV